MIVTLCSLVTQSIFLSSHFLDGSCNINLEFTQNAKIRDADSSRLLKIMQNYTSLNLKVYILFSLSFSLKNVIGFYESITLSRCFSLTAKVYLYAVCPVK